MQITGRIEEVRPQKIAAEAGREAVADVREGNAAGVGGQDGIRLPKLIDT